MNITEKDSGVKLFKVYKTSLDGNQDHWDFFYDLTREESLDAERFPLGKQVDAKGRPFVWQVGINED